LTASFQEKFMLGKTYLLPWRVLVCSGLMVAGAMTAGAASPSDGAGVARTAQVAKDYGKLPLRFEANQGQTDASVRFLSRGAGYQLYLTGEGAVMAVNGPAARGRDGLQGRPQSAVVRMRLAGVKAGAVEGEDQLPGVTNYFKSSDEAEWRTNVVSFGKVRYAGVYPGIDLVYYGNQQQLEYDFQVAAGADPGLIRLRFAEDNRLSLDEGGNLVITAGDARIAFHRPEVYQEAADGIRKPVAGKFSLLADNSVGFAVGSYDHAKPLVIDPTLVYSTFLGGSNTDSLASFAVDSSGNAYITGYTASVDFPVTPGVIQITSTTAFVTKLSATGTALLYSTFLGSGAIPTALVVDKSGDVIVTGTTSSSTFPVTSGVIQTKDKAPTPKGPTGFVTKLNGTGTALVYSTYLGGSISDNPTSLAIDSAGDVYVGGTTTSTDFPVTPGVLQAVNKSAAVYGWNDFVTKLNPTATSLLYSTYLGGSDEYSGETPVLVAIDSAGDAYVSGTAISADFPITPGAYQAKIKAPNGESDMTLTKLNPTATKLLYSTFLGESGNSYGDDVAYGLAVDGSGYAYLAGQTWEANFPTTGSAYQKAYKGGPGVSSGFVTKMNTQGNALVYSTYLGGTGDLYGDSVRGLALDSAGDVYLTGIADSLDFPVTSNAFQKTNAANFYQGPNAFLTELNPAGSALVYSTYFGGSYEEMGTGIALGAGNLVYLMGVAGSPDMPVTGNAFQTTLNAKNGTSGFVTAFDQGAAITTLPTLTSMVSNANPAVTGTNLVYSVTVAPLSGAGVPTGSVTFSIDEVNKIVVPLSSAGQAIYPRAPLPTGEHYILAAYSGSAVYSASAFGLTETITPALPVISPRGGTYTSAQLVSISDGTGGTSTYYTIDGTAPTTSSTRYSGPFLVSANETVRAISAVAGLPVSAVVSATYTLLGAPAALGAPATAVSTTGATLHGWVNTFGMAGSYFFHYGTSSSALTKTTPAVALTGSAVGSVLSFAPVSASTSVTGLTTKTTYYFEVVVSTAAGWTTGAVQSFKTN
jgi:hypothetical protein